MNIGSPPWLDGACRRELKQFKPLNEAELILSF